MEGGREITTSNSFVFHNENQKVMMNWQIRNKDIFKVQRWPVLMHTCYFRTLELEAGGLLVWEFISYPV